MLKKIEDCRIVLVDDQDASLEGRRSWLSAAGFTDVTTLNFPQGLIYQYWDHVHTLAVDGLDETLDDKRQAWIEKLAPGDRLFELDQYMGVRVVKKARAANPNLVITVISGFVDESPELVQRFHAAGANYIYSTRAAHGKDDFLHAIKHPGGGLGIVTPPPPGQKANLEELLAILSGDDREWDPNVVEAVRQVLVYEKKRGDYLEQNPGVSTRKFNELMDYIHDLAGDTKRRPDDPPDHRRMKLEAFRSHLRNNILGRKWKIRGRTDEIG